jgi:hypothetical protein
VKDPFRLDLGTGTFFGIDETIFKQVIEMAHLGTRMEEPIRQFEIIRPFYSAISTLRDGTIISPVEFLRPIEQATF